MAWFWSSADLTGNQTRVKLSGINAAFWSSADLTGNQTQRGGQRSDIGFGAVPI